MKMARRFYRKYHVRQTIIYFLAVWTIFVTIPLPFVWADANPASNALPNGILPGTTVGAGNFNYTVPNQLTINNVQNGAVVNWTNFDIGSAATVNINQASAAAAMLNRIHDGSPTGIMGTLNANGRVFIINPAGVLFGAGSSVNITQLVASSLNLTDAAFQNGINTGQFNFEGGIPGVNPSQEIGIINNGTITGTEGITLIGQKILNNGAIVTGNGGCVVMAAGDKVLLGQPGSKIIVEMASSTSDIEGAGSVINNTTGSITSPDGQIVLAAGDIYSAALNNDSKAVKVDGGNGRAGQFGTVNASGTTGDGGSISLTAGDVVALGSDSWTTANAGTNGNGGEVIVYSPDTALFWDGARIEARGGSESGNGGFVEVSGKENFEIWGSVDTSAPYGDTGTFLIDPYNLTIASGSAGGSGWSGSIWTSSSSNNTLGVTNLLSHLDTSNVTVRTGSGSGGDGDLTVNTAIDYSNSMYNNLTLQAHDDIFVNYLISAGAHNLTLTANSDNSGGSDGGDVIVNAALSSTSGAISASGVNFNSNANGSITSQGGNVTLDAIANITTNAAISLNGGLFTAHAGNSTTSSSAGIFSINQNITAGSISLTAGNQNGFDSGTCRVYVGYTPVSDEAYHAGEGTFSNVLLTSTLGDIVVRAIHDIFIGGNVQSAGKISLIGDIEGRPDQGPGYGGDIITKGNVTASGGVDYMANAIAIGGNVSANGGDLVIEGRSSKDDGGSGSRGTILGTGAWGDITVASGGKLYASGDVSIIDHSKPAGVGKMKLTGNTLLTIQAGDDPTDEITAPDTVISVTGSDSILKMRQGASLNTANYLFANQANTNLTLISDTGSVTSTTGDNAANKWKSIGATANSNITLSGNGRITLGNSHIENDGGTTDATKSLWAKNGNINVTAAGAGNDILATKDLDAGGDMTLNAGDDVDAQMLTAGGSINIYSSDSTTYLHDDVTAGVDIGLHNNTIADNGVKIDAGQDVILTDSKTLTGNGALTVEADRHITLGGAVTTSVVTNGDLIIDADADKNGTGNMHAKGTITNMGGKIDISGVGVDLDGAVTAKGDILVSGVSGSDEGHVNAYGLTSGEGKIDVFSDWYINLFGAVDAYTDLILKADTSMWGDSYINAYSTLTAQTGNMEISAEELVNLQDVATAGGDMTLNADLDNDGTGNLNVNGLVAVGTIDMTAGDSTINIHKSADTLAAADVDAGSDIYLNNNTIADDGVIIDAGHDAILADGKTLDGLGDLTVKAGHDVILGGDVTTVKDMTLNASNDMTAKSNLTSTDGSIDIYSSDSTTYLSGDWVEASDNVTLHNNTILDGSANQRIEAINGRVTANGFLDKIYCGELHITGGEEELAVDIAEFVRANDNIYIKGNGNVQLSGDVTAGEDCINCEIDEIEQGGFVILTAQVVEGCCGGVSIISENGMVYTADAGDALSVTVRGYSNDTEGQGVNLSGNPFDDKGLGKAAIIIISKDDLKLDSGATLQAYGFYNTDNRPVDDRPGMTLLEEDADIPFPDAYSRDPGVPFDVAIYLKSTGKNPDAGQGNVTVDATVSIQSLDEGQEVCTNEGAMVIDAWETVTFGNNFESSIANGDVGNRLEVVSRITEWLEDAVGRLPYASDILNGDPLPSPPFQPGYAYVLRGAGLENPDILLNFNNPDRAWVLVPSSFLVVDDVFSTSWRSGNVTGFDPASLDVLLNDGVKYQASVTDITVTTLGGTLAKVLLTDDGGATHYWGYIYTPPTDVPFVWDGVSDYASFADTFEYQAEKVVNGVTIFSTNTAKVTIDVTNFLPVPGNADTTIHMVTTTNGAPDAKFTLGTDPTITDIDGSPNPLVLGLGNGPTPNTGTPSISGNVVTYHPLDGYVTGGTPDSFEYTVNDESIVSATADPVERTGTLEVSITNTSPTGDSWLGTTHMDTAKLNAALVTDGFSDAEGDTVTVGTGPYSGAVIGSSLYGGTLTYDGDYTYNPDATLPGYVGDDADDFAAPGYVADDKFTVQLTDGQRNYVFDGSGNIISDDLVYSNGTVSVDLTNTLPSGSGDLGSTPEGIILIVTQNGVSDPVGVSDQDNGLDILSHVIGSYNGSHGGTLVFNGTKWIYTPAPGYVGSEEFTINVWDGENNYMFVKGDISSVVPEYGNGTVTVTVTATEIEPILPAAPLPVIRLPEISGCPVLMGAVAVELGINSEYLQIAIGSSLTDTPDTQPCEACEKVVNYAGILKDEQGQHMAAMVQVFNQLAPANAPFSPEMGAMIANAFADYKNNPDMPQYATAMEYIDAFVEYAKVLDTELGAPVGDSTAFVLEKYGSNLTKAENENILMYIQTQLGKSTGGPTAKLSN